MNPRFDCTSMGFITFDALCRPVTDIPPDGDTYFVEDFTLAVSGAAGSAVIVAAKPGLRAHAVGGIGQDGMGDWVRMKLGRFGTDTAMMARCNGFTTSSSIVTIRPDGARPALHKRGATDGFCIDDDRVDDLLDTRILHVAGVGLMNRVDTGRTEEILREAKQRGVITTFDGFASTADDLPKVVRLLPHTDYFLPSEEGARALSGLAGNRDLAQFLIDKGTGCVILTPGADGAIYRHRDGTEFHSPAFQVEVKCNCGSGDCFNGGFATGLIRGLIAQEPVRLAQASSAQNATGLGSQAGVKDYATTLAFRQATPTRTLRHSLVSATVSGMREPSTAEVTFVRPLPHAPRPDAPARSAAGPTVHVSARRRDFGRDHDTGTPAGVRRRHCRRGAARTRRDCQKRRRNRVRPGQDRARP